MNEEEFVKLKVGDLVVVTWSSSEYPKQTRLIRRVTKTGLGKFAALSIWIDPSVEYPIDQYTDAEGYTPYAGPFSHSWVQFPPFSVLRDYASALDNKEEGKRLLGLAAARRLLGGVG